MKNIISLDQLSLSSVYCLSARQALFPLLYCLSVRLTTVQHILTSALPHLYYFLLAFVAHCTKALAFIAIPWTSSESLGIDHILSWDTSPYTDIVP
jgi:hypothetical protein